MKRLILLLILCTPANAAEMLIESSTGEVVAIYDDGHWDGRIPYEHNPVFRLVKLPGVSKQDVAYLRDTDPNGIALHTVTLGGTKKVAIAKTIANLDDVDPCEVIIPQVGPFSYQNKWLCSYETSKWDTPSGDIGVGEYGDATGEGYFIRTKSEVDGHYEHVPKTHDVSLLKRVTRVAGQHNYYAEFLTAKGAGEKWGDGKTDLSSGCIVRREITGQEYWANANLKANPPPHRSEVVLTLPPPEPPRVLPTHHSIAHDATSNSGAKEDSSSYSWSHTCEGGERLLVVGNSLRHSATQYTCTGITFNGDPLTLAKSEIYAPGSKQEAAIYYRIAPDVDGSYTVAVTLSGAPDYSGACAVSYTGAKQSGQPDATAGWGGLDVAGDVETTVTTSADHSWVFAAAFITSTSNPDVSETQRAELVTGVYFNSFQDTGVGVTPAGAQLMNVFNVDTSGVIAAASFAPATEIHRYVDTGSAGGNGGTDAVSGNSAAYDTLSAWEAAEDNTGDLVTNEVSMTVHCNRTNGGGVDEAKLTIDSWTTSASYDITIQGDLESDGKTGFPDEDGIYDNTLYLLQYTTVTTGEATIHPQENFITFRNLQVGQIRTHAGSKLIYNQLQTAGAVITIDSCLLKATQSGGGKGEGVYAGDSDATVNIYNTVITGLTGADSAGVYTETDDFNIYNCIIYNCTYGIWVYGGSSVINAYNCAVISGGNDVLESASGAINLSYCGTEDGDDVPGDNNFQITQTADDYAALVEGAAGDDFNIKDVSSELYNQGDVGELPSTDITGYTWDTPDIGAFAWQAVAAGGGGQVIIISF